MNINKRAQKYISCYIRYTPIAHKVTMPHHYYIWVYMCNFKIKWKYCSGKNNIASNITIRNTISFGCILFENYLREIIIINEHYWTFRKLYVMHRFMIISEIHPVCYYILLRRLLLICLTMHQHNRAILHHSNSRSLFIN